MPMKSFFKKFRQLRKKQQMKQTEQSKTIMFSLDFIFSV